MLLDLSCNTFLIKLLLLRAASVGQLRGVEDANLENTLHYSSR